MNTPTNAYFTKISSGTILALLAISAIVFLIPLATPAFASNASLPTITVSSGNPLPGGVPASITLTVSNPTSNEYTVTGITVNVPSGWTIEDCTGGGFLVSCTNSAGSATWTVSQFLIGTAAGIPPGGNDQLEFDAVPATAATTYPFTSALTTKVQDASAISFYNGPSFTIQVMDPDTTATVAVTAGNSNTAVAYTAGTAPYTVTATVTCGADQGTSVCPGTGEPGLPVVWYAPDYAAGVTYSFTPAKGTTNTAGTTTSTFQPSNIAPDSSGIQVEIGTSDYYSVETLAIVTSAGAPAKLEFYLTAVAPANEFGSGTTDYVTLQGTTTNTHDVPPVTFTGAEVIDTGLLFAVTDQFLNPVTFASITFGATQGATLTALSGGGLFDNTNLPNQVTCTGAACTAAPWTLTGASGTVPYNYFQNGNYYSIGVLSATITGTYGTSAFSVSGNSGNIVTSTFSVASPVPGIGAPPGNVNLNIKAGSTVAVWATLPVVQAGVPVTLYLDTGTSFETVAGAMDYGAHSMLPTHFAGGVEFVTLDTNSSGMVQAAFTVDTVAGSVAYFQANVLAPINGAPTNMLGNSTDSFSATTVAGAIGEFVIISYFYVDNTPPPPVFNGPTTYSVPGGTLYVDVSLADAYGNPVSLPGNANTIQVNLAATEGTLSVTSAYITAGHSDTGTSFGAVVWTMPSATGSSTLTASGVVNGKAIVNTEAVTIVSPLPALFVISPAPTSGTLYSSTTAIIFSGNASISNGYPATNDPVTSSGADVIESVCWTVAGVSNGCTPISQTASTTWSASVNLAAGLHTVQFNATDAEGNTAISPTYNVVVDTTTPTVTFSTANGADLTNGAPATATIVVAEGDLNATSVVATVNGTALAASHVTVAGSNNLGTSVTYTVTISGLPSGTDNLGLSATSFAGLTGTATGITVNVVVPFAQSVVINSATQGTLGSYSGISVSATNLWSTSQSLVAFAVFKNGAGQTVAVATGGLTLASGASGSTFAPLASPLPPGTYTVNVFVITTANQGVSSTTTISATF